MQEQAQEDEDWQGHDSDAADRAREAYDLPLMGYHSSEDESELEASEAVARSIAIQRYQPTASSTWRLHILVPDEQEALIGGRELRATLSAYKNEKKKKNNTKRKITNAARLPWPTMADHRMNIRNF